MKVLFVYPDLNIDVNWQGHYYEGIASLSATLKSVGHQVELAHIYNLSKGNSIITQIRQGVDLVAFSCTTPMFPYVKHCSSIIKKEFGDKIPLLCGGAHPTSAPERVLVESLVDYACMGEGERFILEFMDYLKGERKKEDIRNFVYRDSSGKVVMNELGEAINPLDKLPFPDRGIFDLQHRNTDVANISAGRGCPYKCAYCSNNYLNKVYKNKYLRLRRPVTVLNEIKLLLEMYPHIKQLAFLDDVFLLDGVWLSEFCSLYREAVRIPFKALAHPQVITAEKIAILKAAGCNEIGFGIQSGNEHIRNKVMLRQVSDKKIKEAISIFKESGMKFLADIIFGVPSENKRQMLDTIKMCAESGVEAKSHIFYPLPNTNLEQLARELGMISEGVYGEDYHSKTILKYSSLQKARILFFHRYSKPLIAIYRDIIFKGRKGGTGKLKVFFLDHLLCGDPAIYLVMKLRHLFLRARSVLRSVRGVQEFALDKIR